MKQDDIYAFVFRGMLTEDALDKAGRRTRAKGTELLPSEVVERISLSLIDEKYIVPASKMAVVYTTIASFENSVRDLISETLLETGGENWWEAKVTEGIRKKAESRRVEEDKIRWHSTRGDHLINYTDFGQLMSRIPTNWADFVDLLQSQQWVQHIFETMERSRNVIMHSGTLPNEDIERVGICIRDWVKQTGG